MDIKEEIIIDPPLINVWKKITDIENSAEFVSGIDKIDIIEKSNNHLVGLKWEETRTLFGRTATEIMWITEAEDNQYYKTRPEGPGVVYLTTLSVSKQDDKTRLVMDFETEISSVGTKIMAGIMSIFF